MYAASILADSLSPDGIRLTTFEVTLPRFLAAEFNTHRALSRNAASSRAEPTEKLIARVRENPFVPDFNHRVKGMGVGAPLTDDEQVTARIYWEMALFNCISAAKALLRTDKSRVNRLLEPFAWHTLIVTATDWSNFFALRTASNAQPEFRTIATLMKEQYDNHEPTQLEHDQWHTPLVTPEEKATDGADWKQISTARCGRASYLTHRGTRDLDADQRLHDGLVSDGHMSPLEHPARPFTLTEWAVIRDLQVYLRIEWKHRDPQLIERLCRQAEYCGNLRGWHSYRYDVPNQHDFSLMSAA